MGRWIGSCSGSYYRADDGREYTGIEATRREKADIKAAADKAAKKAAEAETKR